MSTADGVYFATDTYAEIPTGSTTVDVVATCTTIGQEGNGVSVGEINTIVDPIPYVASAANINTSVGGADIESDEVFAERIYLSPSAYSTAGPEDSYKYHARRYNAAIGDVVASSQQAAGKVNIVFLMEDGSTPDSATIAGLQAHLNDKTIRPMTDVVTVSAPTEVSYTIGLTYYINRSDSAQAVAIQTAVNQAVNDYVQWQRHIGKDINPSKLTALVMAAGAKRVSLTAPAYTTVGASAVAALAGSPTVNYGGLEDD